MSRDAPERQCPKCRTSDIEPNGVTATFYPRQVLGERVIKRDRKVVEQRFRCRGCGHEFVEIEEQEF